MKNIWFRMYSWVASNIRKLVFFIIFFVGFGTSSIWMSLLFLDVDYDDVIVGFLTISIAAVYTSAERILTMMRTKKIQNNEDIIELIAVALPIIISCLVIGFLKKSIIVSAIISGITYLLYCRLWWHQNRDNMALDENFNTLGGKIN